MNPLVYTAAQVVEMFPLELKVTEYWVNATARKHKLGTIIRRKRVFTRSQVERLVELQAIESQPLPPKAQERAKTQRPLKVKPKPLPAADTAVTPLQSRPERARSYGRPA